MWMSVLKTTEDAVSLPLVSTYLTASIASAMLDTPVMVLPAQVRHPFCRLLYRIYFNLVHLLCFATARLKIEV